MSIEDFCSQDTVTVLLEGITTDSHMGVDETPTTVGTLSCLVQQMAVGEARGGNNRNGGLLYDARDQRTNLMFFFSANPSLTLRNRLNWGGRIARILGVYSEGRSGEDLLWIAECEEVKSRPESLA